jgi:5,10-methylene-tetrahydrofolate dehydrogenase/methenyl tetrahydrofolate cyclohydrolase
MEQFASLNLQGVRILVIEDSRMVGRALKGVLELTGRM